MRETTHIERELTQLHAIKKMTDNDQERVAIVCVCVND